MWGWNNPMPIGQSWGERRGGHGWKVCLVLREGHSSRCTDQRATGIYSTRDSPQWRSSKLATTRILVSKLATARVFCPPQPTGSGLPASPALIPHFYFILPTAYEPSSPSKSRFLLLLKYFGVSFSTPHIPAASPGPKKDSLENSLSEPKGGTHRSVMFRGALRS